MSDWQWALQIFRLGKFCKIKEYIPQEIFPGYFAFNVPEMGTPRMMEILASMWGMRIGPAPIESYQREKNYQNGVFKIDFWTNLPIQKLSLSVS